MLALSHQRDSELRADLSYLEAGGRSSPDGSDQWDLTRQMKIVAQQLLLLDGPLSRRAEEIWSVHKDAEKSYYPSQDRYEDVGQLLPDRERLEKAHDALVADFRSTVRRKA